MLSTINKIRLAKIAYNMISTVRKIFGLTDNLTATRSYLKWNLDLSEGIDFSIYLLGVFERSTVNTYRRLIMPGNTVIDIGANIGAHTLHMARCAGTNGCVIAFEPTSFAYQKLANNISLNSELINRIKIEQIILSEDQTADTAPEIYSSWPLVGSTKVHPKHRGQLMSTSGAKAISLDTYLKNNNIEKVDFIKMDVDGNECSVLRGAQATLNRDNPDILMELMPYGLEETGHSLKELIQILTDIGYVLFRIPGRQELPSGVDKLERYIPKAGSINVLCRNKKNKKNICLS